jgi:hypothetical protein
MHQRHCTYVGGYKKISDREPLLTELVRTTLREAAQGKVNLDSIAPGSRDHLIPFLERIGARYLTRAGTLESLVLLEDASSGQKRVRRYRSVFASGRRIIWIVGLSSEGTIVSVEPQPE